MDEIFEYESDSTVVLSDEFRDPEKSARKRRKLEIILQTNRNIDNNTDIMLSKVPIVNLPTDNKQERNNDPELRRRYIGRLAETNNNSDSICEERNIKMQLLNAENSQEREYCDNEVVQDNEVITISDDSCDECINTTNVTNKQAGENANLHPKIGASVPSAINTEGAITNSEENEVYEKTNRLQSNDSSSSAVDRAGVIAKNIQEINENEESDTAVVNINDPKKINTSHDEIVRKENEGSCDSNLGSNTNTVENPVPLRNITYENYVQDDLAETRQCNESDVNKLDYTVKEHTMVDQQESINHKEIEMCSDKAATQFLISFFTTAKEYFNEIFKNNEAVSKLRVPARFVKNEIKYVLRYFENNWASKVRYVCPKCLQPSVYSPKAMYQIGDDGKPLPEHTKLKCTLCRGLQLLHHTHLQSYFAKPSVDEYDTINTPETRQDNASRLSIAINRDIDVSAKSNPAASRTSMSVTHDKTDDSNVGSPAVTATSADNVVPTKTGVNTATMSNKNDEVTSGNFKSKSCKRPFDNNVSPVKPKRGETDNTGNGSTKVVKNNLNHHKDSSSTTDIATTPLAEPTSFNNTDNNLTNTTTRISDEGNPRNNNGMVSFEEKKVQVTQALVGFFTKFQTKKKYENKETENIHTCPECTTSFDSYTSLMVHRGENHNIAEQFSTIICPLCEIRLNENNYMAHVEVHFPDKDNNIRDGGDKKPTEVTNSRRNLTAIDSENQQQNEATIAKSSESKQYECKICKGVLVSSYAREKHKEQVHGHLDLKNMKLFRVAKKQELLRSVQNQSSSCLENISEDNSTNIENEKEIANPETEGAVNEREGSRNNETNEEVDKLQNSVKRGSGYDNSCSAVNTEMTRDPLLGSIDQGDVGVVPKSTCTTVVDKAEGERNDIDMNDSENSNKKSTSENSPEHATVSESKAPGTDSSPNAADGSSKPLEDETNGEQKKPKCIFPSTSGRPALAYCYNCRINIDVYEMDNHYCRQKLIGTPYNCFTCGVNILNDDTHKCENENKVSIGNIEITNVATVKEVYVFKCEDCNVATEVYDDVISHCQNHYNGVTVPTVFCETCQLSYETDSFKKHKYLHDEYVKITSYSYKCLFFNWDTTFKDIPSHIVKEMQEQSIYRSHCVKMRVISDGPWQYTLYQCKQCEACVTPGTVEHHCRRGCYPFNYPCSKCDKLFTSFQMSVSHELDHEKTELFKIIQFNCKRDEHFNNQLFETRLTELQSRIPIADIFKCVCGVCFISNEGLKNHFVACNSEGKGEPCGRCVVPRLFDANDLENHLRLHHGAVVYKFRINSIVMQQDIETFCCLDQNLIKTEDER